MKGVKLFNDSQPNGFWSYSKCQTKNDDIDKTSTYLLCCKHVEDSDFMKNFLTRNVFGEYDWAPETDARMA